MYTTGIVSVTFRALSIDEIFKLCRENSLAAIEIGSDVHAPKEDIAECDRIAKLAHECGVDIVSYGTYYRLGSYADPTAEFIAYLNAAKALGTKNLRLWAGSKGSAQATPDQRSAWISEAKECARLAADADMTISFEYHQGTLTDNCDSALDFIESIAAGNASLYWQPNQSFDFDVNVAALERVKKHVTSIHVFAWDARSGTNIKYPLADQTREWQKYLEILAAEKKPRALLLEFVKDDSPEQLAADAKTVNEWSKSYAL